MTTIQVLPYRKKCDHGNNSLAQPDASLFLARKEVLLKHVAAFTHSQLEPSTKRVVHMPIATDRPLPMAQEDSPCPVVPNSGSKSYAMAEIVVTDGQASSNEEEMKNLVEGVILFCCQLLPKEIYRINNYMTRMINKYKIPYAALLVKVDSQRSCTEMLEKCLKGLA